jgi:hypothetical protein
MKPRFDIDDQRGAICFFGLVALAVELVAYYLTGKVPPGELTGGFFTMAIGPVISSTWQRYTELRRQESEEDPPERVEKPASSRKPRRKTP